MSQHVRQATDRRTSSDRGRPFTLADPPPWLVGILVGVVFGLWRLPVLRQLPVWDGAMGMVPAAITLEKLGFRVGELLAMPGYEAGGPRVHALSAMTWLTAGAIRAFGSFSAALPFLHLLSFAVLGALAAGVFRLVRRAEGNPGLAWLAVAAAVLFPPMVVQASDVYMDLPLATAATWALVLLLEGRVAGAVALACLAAAIKASAAILLPVMAVLVLLRGERVVPRLAALTIPALVAVAPLLVNQGVSEAVMEPDNWAQMVPRLTLLYIGKTPLLVAVALALVSLLVVLRVRSGVRESHPAAWHLAVAGSVFAASYLAFFCLNPLVSKGVAALPRYTTLVAPVLLSAVIVATAALLGRRGGYGAGTLLTGLCVANLGGGLAPESDNYFFLTERSLAYEQHLLVQESAFRRFQELGDSIPLLYDHFAHFRFSYPEMGWAPSRPRVGMHAGLLPDGEPTLAALPDTFAALIEAPMLGGAQVRDVVRRALASDEWHLREERFASGEFVSWIFIGIREDGSPTEPDTAGP